MSSWFDGIKIDEVAFCEAFTEECPLIFVDGVFYTKDGTTSEQLEKQITDKLIAERVKQGISKKGGVAARFAESKRLLREVRQRCGQNKCAKRCTTTGRQLYGGAEILPKQTECAL